MRAFFGVIKALSDLFLQVTVQNIGGAPGRVVQIGANAQKEIVGRLDPSLIGLTQPVSANQVFCRKRALLKIRHPKQVLIIAQAAATALHMRLLQINAVAEFVMPGRLILHAQFRVFAFVTGDTFRPELFAKLIRQLGITGEIPRLEHRGFRKHIAVCLRDRFFDRASGMSHFETNIPKQIEDLLYHLFDIWRNPARALPVQKHDIDVAEWIELAAAVSAEGDECQRRLTRTGSFASRGGRGRKGMPQ